MEYAAKAGSKKKKFVCSLRPVLQTAIRTGHGLSGSFACPLHKSPWPFDTLPHQDCLF